MSTHHPHVRSSPNRGTWVAVWVPLPPCPSFMAPSTNYRLDPASCADIAQQDLCASCGEGAELSQPGNLMGWADKTGLLPLAMDYPTLHQDYNTSPLTPVPATNREAAQLKQNKEAIAPPPSEHSFMENLESYLPDDIDWNALPPLDDGLLIPEQMHLSSYDAVHATSPSTEQYMSTTSSPGSSRSSEYTMYPCTEPTCSRSFPSLSLRNKHQRKHSKPFTCSVCGKGHSAKRDLHRHLWVKHPEYAERAHVPSQTRKCDFAGCAFEGRQDNLARHIRKLHGA